MRSWSNICRKKSNALADAGRGLVVPTSSVKEYLGRYKISAGVSLLGFLIGASPFLQLEAGALVAGVLVVGALVAVLVARVLVGGVLVGRILVVEMSSTAGEVTELAFLPLSLLSPHSMTIPSHYFNRRNRNRSRRSKTRRNRVKRPNPKRRQANRNKHSGNGTGLQDISSNKPPSLWCLRRQVSSFRKRGR